MNQLILGRQPGCGLYQIADPLHTDQQVMKRAVLGACSTQVDLTLHSVQCGVPADTAVSPAASKADRISSRLCTSIGSPATTPLLEM